MPHPLFDRSKLKVRPLAERESYLAAEKTIIDPDVALAKPMDVGSAAPQIARVAERIRRARRKGASVMMAFGAHAIKNGLGRVLARLAEEGWVTHFATNGAAHRVRTIDDSLREIASRKALGGEEGARRR